MERPLYNKNNLLLVRIIKQSNKEARIACGMWAFYVADIINEIWANCKDNSAKVNGKDFHHATNRCQTQTWKINRFSASWGPN